MIGEIVIVAVAAIGLAFSSPQKKQKNDSDTYRIESKYDVDSAKVTDLYLQAIREKVLYKDLSKAYSIFNKILDIDSLHGPTLYQMAQKGGDINKSIEYLERALQNDPDNREYLYLKIILCSNSNNPTEAIGTIDKLLEKNNKKINLHLQKAQIQDSYNMPFEAVSTLDSAKVLFGKRPEILMYQQELYSRLNMTRKSIETAQELVSSFPDNQDLIISLAQAYAAEKNLEQASIHFEIAKRLDPSSLNFQVAINEFYQQNGSVAQYMGSLNDLFSNKGLELNRKIDYFNSVIKKAEFYRDYYPQVEALVNTLRVAYAGNWEVAELYAMHLINSGLTKEASNVYKEYLEDEQYKRRAYEQVIGIESYLNDEPDKLLEYCNSALNIFKDDTDIKLLISNVYTLQGDVNKAISITEECVAAAQNDSLKSAYIGYIGDLYYQLNNLKKTYKYYDNALKLDPNNIIVLNNYSYFLSEENKNLEKALTMSSLVVSKEPDNATYIDTYGWILYKLGRYEEAKKEIRRAIALDTTNNSELLLHLGDIFAAQGDTISANIYWDRAVTAGADSSVVEERKNGGSSEKNSKK
ncbi:MAG: tetratricopeptide repeat protein [Rikenellaceae bacterium]